MPDASLDQATQALSTLATGVTILTDEVKRAEDLRTRKIQMIQAVLYVMVPAIALLLALAVTNFLLLAKVRQTATDARNTNALLASCFQPNTPCSTANQRNTAEALNQIRQTQFVIAICQRQNPVDRDPDGAHVIACVQRYYPAFALPPRAK